MYRSTGSHLQWSNPIMPQEDQRCCNCAALPGTMPVYWVSILWVSLDVSHKTLPGVVETEKRWCCTPHASVSTRNHSKPVPRSHPTCWGKYEHNFGFHLQCKTTFHAMEKFWDWTCAQIASVILQRDHWKYGIVSELYWWIEPAAEMAVNEERSGENCSEIAQGLLCHLFGRHYPALATPESLLSDLSWSWSANKKKQKQKNPPPNRDWV